MRILLSIVGIHRSFRADHESVDTGVSAAWTMPVTREMTSNIQSVEYNNMRYDPPEDSLSARAQSLVNKNERDGGHQDAAIVQAEEHSTVPGELPKGSFASKAQSAAEKNLVGGRMRSVYDVSRK
ncbi:hypothetical protein M422DRAFT_49056 [Sphaerobolus stellatus SS14]|uniref:SMP domain-containing protein n=1 Tax=Sphaerobolus stellatus (strain SS14) TaxID=990650 RepID=A0A0C9VH37_SPHS4|nr:hypothetical protein M422DRAFT_49056 [Sphaerobolus stellatus SS14]